jgi:hypothetical protein
VWESRTPLDPVERAVFALTVDRQRFQARGELGIDQEEELDHCVRPANRVAAEAGWCEPGRCVRQCGVGLASVC